MIMYAQLKSAPTFSASSPPVAALAKQRALSDTALAVAPNRGGGVASSSTPQHRFDPCVAAGRCGSVQGFGLKAVPLLLSAGSADVRL